MELITLIIKINYYLLIMHFSTAWDGSERYGSLK